MGYVKKLNKITSEETVTTFKEYIIYGQSFYHRHDLTARVFKPKLIKLMNLIIINRVYGEV